ncbi:hypothetical protein [Ornithinimicrobium sp. Y1694]|uniref:hypothetical protein n=1 Tax=Ornithinimicrobium sp. Y1694 TaxID=3418590 RepID=UPI003CEABC47
MREAGKFSDETEDHEPVRWTEPEELDEDEQAYVEKLADRDEAAAVVAATRGRVSGRSVTHRPEDGPTLTYLDALDALERDQLDDLVSAVRAGRGRSRTHRSAGRQANHVRDGAAHLAVDSGKADR